MADLPSLFDRADGLDGREGIATPRGVILVADNGTLSDWTDQPAILLRELANSPEVERAEQATITKTFLMDYEQAKTRLSTMGRGTILVDEEGDVTRVLSAKLTRERPGYAILTVVAEGVSFDSPPDEFDVQPVELGVHIIKHPRYFYALDPTSADDDNSVTVNDVTVSLSDVKQSIIRTIQAYMDAPFYPMGGNINGMFQTNIMEQLSAQTIEVPYANPYYSTAKTLVNPKLWDGDITNYPLNDSNEVENCRYFLVPVPVSSPGILLAIAAAKEIIGKIWRQEEQPYIVGYQMTWSQYFFRPPAMSCGGYIEDPIWNGQEEVPDYFISTEYPPDRDGTIFDLLPIDNPQCYSLTGAIIDHRGVYNEDYMISWLRKADRIEYQRTWFKITKTWMGAPIGHWDTELYGYHARPSVPEDYVTKFLSLGG